MPGFNAAKRGGIVRRYFCGLMIAVNLGALALGAYAGSAQGAPPLPSECEKTNEARPPECSELASEYAAAYADAGRALFAAKDEAGTAGSGSGYQVRKRFSIPGEGGWDYISVDPDSRRLYVSHGTELEVLDAGSGKIIGQIPDTPGVHGAAIAPELKRGFTSNGRDKSVTIFSTETLKTIQKVSVNGTDAIVYDPFTQRIFPMTEKVTVIDAKTGDLAGEVDLGGSPEAGAADGKGTVYVNLADKKAVAVVDAQALKVTATYPIDYCTSPHSLSYDAANQRLFVGCRDGLAVLDATNGKVVGRSQICSGVDSGGFDPESKLIFESCGEGVISVIQQVTADYYVLMDTVKTEIGAKTMAFDAKTKKIFLPTAEFETVPNTDPKFPYPFKRQIKPGSFHVLVVAPH